MKTITMFALCLCCLPAQAHHTKDHTMLVVNPEQVIAATRAGAREPTPTATDKW